MKFYVKHKLFFRVVLLMIMLSVVVISGAGSKDVYSDESSTLEEIGSFADSANDVVIENGMAYVAMYERVQIYSLSNLSEISKIGEYYKEGCNFESLDIVQSSLYVTQTKSTCAAGQLHVLDVTDPANPQNALQNPIMVSNAPPVEIKIVDSIAYMAIVQDGLGIVDLSDLSNPVIYPKYDPPKGTFRDLDVADGRVYLANVTGGFMIIDVSDLVDIKTLAEVDFPSGQFADYHAYGIKYSLGKVYISGGERLLKIFDVGDVFNVQELFSSPKAGSLSYDVDIADNHLFVLRKNTGLYVFDSTISSNPIQIAEHLTNESYSKMIVEGKHVFIYDPVNGVKILKFSGIGEPTPTPSPLPEAFLDLPWDYRGQGLSFIDAALSINSYFDHQYPLLSTSLAEPVLSKSNVLGYDGSLSKQFERFYSSHDGYDWGRNAGTVYGVPQTAAADGIATFVDTCTPCGNAIYIDHRNGYQTRYYHLQPNGLIINVPGMGVAVAKGQQIGLTGFSGYTRPRSESGAHVHFMVVQDKDGDGDFNDNIPDGLTDPFGWQGSMPDPWEHYSFRYKDIDMTGNSSHYLWTSSLNPIVGEVTNIGDEFEINRFKVVFPPNSYESTFRVQFEHSPIVVVSETRNSIGPSLIFTSSTFSGEDISEFDTNFTLFFDFKDFDLDAYDLGSLAIYSSQDGLNWSMEETEVNFDTQTASVQINHLTHFALMADRFDTTPPETTAIVNGEGNGSDVFRSDVEIFLNSVDSQSEIAYTAYSINEGGFEEYSNPIYLNAEGTYDLVYYSEDIYGNVEKENEVIIAIDKTLPEVIFTYDKDSRTIVVDSVSGNDSISMVQDGKKTIVRAVDSAGNTLSITGRFSFVGANPNVSIVRMVYNNEVFDLFVNRFAVQGGSDHKILQSFLTSNYQVRLLYPYNGDNTRVHTVQEGGQGSIVESGMKILSITTNKGTIYESYE